MFGNPYSPVMPPYGGYPQNFNPITGPQQRLAELEQQYMNQTQQANPQTAQGPMFLKGRAVTSFDEAKAALIDLDGSLHVFTDIGNGCIYTKQINLDGTATLKTYRLDTPQEAQKSPETNEKETIDLSSYVQHKDLENVCQTFNMQFDSLEDKLKSYDMALQQLAAEKKGGSKK